MDWRKTCFDPDTEIEHEAAALDDADLLYRLKRALLMLDAGEARRLVEGARGGRAAVEVVETVIAPALDQIGRAWEAGTVALSQVYMCGRLCEGLVTTLLPAPGGTGPPCAPIAIATLDDYHLLGKRIVLAALRASGLAVRDYGRATAAEVAARARADGVEILLLSTLMLPSALRVKEVRALLACGAKAVRLVVGGAPFRLDRRLAEEVGADEVGMNSGDAVAIVHRLTKRPSCALPA